MSGFWEELFGKERRRRGEMTMEQVPLTRVVATGLERIAADPEAVQRRESRPDAAETGGIR